MNKLPKLVEDYQTEHRERTGQEIYQRDIAKMAGIDVSTFSRYVNGHVGSINLDIWQRLSDFFGVEGHEIFDLTPQGEKEL